MVFSLKSPGKQFYDLLRYDDFGRFLISKDTTGAIKIHISNLRRKISWQFKYTDFKEGRVKTITLVRPESRLVGGGAKSATEERYAKLGQ